MTIFCRDRWLSVALTLGLAALPTGAFAPPSQAQGLLQAQSLAQAEGGAILETVLPEPSPVAPDYDLLARVIQKQFGSAAYETESRMRFIGAFEGNQFNAQIQTKTLTAAPNQFRSEVQFLDEAGQPVRAFLILSDGEQVSILDRDRNQYSTLSTAAFSSSNDDFLIGLSASFVLSMQADFSTELESLSELDPKSLAELIQSGLSGEAQEDISFGELSLAGQQISTIALDVPTESLFMTVGMEAETGDLSLFQILGQANQVDVEIVETVESRKALATVPADAFVFTPPPGAELASEPIDLSPF